MLLQGAFNSISKKISFESVENIKVRNFNWFFNLELNPSEDIDKSIINIRYEKMKWLIISFAIGFLSCNDRL
jgi:hypothetical protein